MTPTPPSGHFFTAKTQPATHYRLWSGYVWMGNPKRRQLHCHKCRQRRWAMYLVAQVYYDNTYFWCAPGHGCAKGKP